MRKTCLALLIIFIFFSSLYAKCYFQSTHHLSQAQQALGQLDYRLAIEQLESSIRFKAPLLQPKQAISLLYEIAENNADQTIRRQALISLKSALISSNQTAQIPGASLNQLEQKIRQTYSEPADVKLISEMPKAGYNKSYQLLADFSFLTWIGFVILAIWFGLSPDGIIKKNTALKFISMAVVFLLVWLAALAKA